MDGTTAICLLFFTFGLPFILLLTHENLKLQSEVKEWKMLSKYLNMDRMAHQADGYIYSGRQKRKRLKG